MKPVFLALIDFLISWDSLIKFFFSFFQLNLA